MLVDVQFPVEFQNFQNCIYFLFNLPSEQLTDRFQTNCFGHLTRTLRISIHIWNIIIIIIIKSISSRWFLKMLLLWRACTCHGIVLTYKGTYLKQSDIHKVSCLEGIWIDALRVLLSFCEYCCNMGVLLYFTLDAGLLARSQHSEGPATGHLEHRFFLVSVCLSKSKCWDGSQHSKLSLHASHVAL